ncbi:S41 family peptidase [Flavobacterium daemonense]|uniref:S41 family peptidase n=1 Tax=Flavobacterium daemonense TaxID=1393049 RepID=UPI0011849896|nr:S41 family peptidase [Flavobacterium daemonense]KAF2337003.1 hypothetical protein FND99_00940 [Flavobacterium daemonense]
MIKKNIFAITLCFCFIVQMFSQEKISATEKYKQFGLVWGLMKYQHYEVSNGKYNWDEIFIENFDKLESVTTQTNLDVFLLNFITSIPESKIKTDTNTDNLFTKNYDYKWIENYSGNTALFSKLKKLENNTNIGFYYTSKGGIPTFDNEKGFKGFDYKTKSHRLLELFSFWNVIQYHDVNKYLMDKNWYSQLESFIDEFSKSTSQLEYELAKMHSIASLNDSHSYFFSKTVLDSLFKFKAPITTTNVNDTLVVSGMFNKLAEKDNLKLGDLIVEINDMDIKSFRKQKIGSLISSSNERHLERLTWFLLMNKEDSLKVKIKRKDVVATKYIHLYKTFPKDEEQSRLPFFSYKKEWEIIEDKIGYINLSTISKEDTKKAFEAFSNTDGIILDLRNYPKNISGEEIANYIYPDRKEFIKILFPLKQRPSLSHFDKPAISAIVDPFKAGHKNSKYYNKKIILLVYGGTQSRAEYIGMAIQAAPNCITVGKTTSGAPVNVAIFKLPDGEEFQFTCMGGFYPDGTQVQRNGLKIDHFVKQTTSNFNEDQFIHTGIKLIKSAANKGI